MNKKGFVLIETIIVVSVISLFMINTFAFTSTTIKKYEQRNKYEQIDSIYGLNSIKIFLYKFTDVNKLLNNNKIELSERNIADYLIDIIKENEGETYFIKLKNSLELDELYVVNINNIKDIQTNNLEFKDYLKTIDTGNSTTDYRLIGRFKNGYANINIHRVS